MKRILPLFLSGLTISFGVLCSACLLSDRTRPSEALPAVSATVTAAPVFVTAPVSPSEPVTDVTPEPPATTVTSTSTPAASAPSEIRPTRLILPEVTYLSQKPDYPNGCESVCAVMALRFLGIDLSVDTFIDRYLDRGNAPIPGGTGPDPSLLYGGDPRSDDGWGCYAPVIAEALGRILDPTEVSLHCSETMTLEELCRTYLDRGCPVIVWGLLKMQPYSAPWYYTSWTTDEGKTILYHLNTHCLLLVGYDETSYYFHDPLVGAYVAYDKENCERSFALLGKQSIALLPR